MTDVPRDFERIFCPMCGAAPSTLVHKGKDWALHDPAMLFHVVKCNVCKFAYLNPRPKPAILSRYYTETYAPYGR